MYCARVVEGLLIQDRCLITEECRYMNLISLDAPGLRIVLESVILLSHA